MPGTKQLILNGFGGPYLGGWNYAIDTHMTHILVDLETALERTLERPIRCTIMDSEGGGLPLGERYAEAERGYISVLSREHTYSLADFAVDGRWEPVAGDPEREAAFAHWADAQRAAEDPRQFVLMRLVGRTAPTRIYTGLFEAHRSAGQVPWLHRRRWPYNELRIRDLIRGANLNVNYGYTYTEVPNRTRQREWERAQERVVVTERQLMDCQAAVHNLRQRLAAFQDAYAAQRRKLERQLARRRLELQRRQRSGQAITRARRRVDSTRRQVAVLAQRFQRQQQRLLLQLHGHKVRSRQLLTRLRHRTAVRDAIDTQTLCRERDLEKDQIMLNQQILLANLHDWAAESYFAPA
jgi:hypothetical protein